MWGVFLAWLAAVVSNVEKLSSSESMFIFRRAVPKRTIGYSMIIISTAGLIGTIVSSYLLEKKLRETKDVITRMDASLFNEASGGTAIGRFAYIVDDEQPLIFKLELNDDGTEYLYKKDIPLKLGTFRTKKDDQTIIPPPNENKNRVDQICTDEIADKDCIDDLEAAASEPSEAGSRRLYLVTSHSNKESGKIAKSRRRFLEVSLEQGREGEITNFQSDLIDAIVKELGRLANSQHDEKLKVLIRDMLNEGTAKAKKLGGVQIEGLAIDESNRAYSGLREPLVTKGNAQYAIVLRAELADILKGKPNFETLLLNLSQGQESYGIVSLDYDARTRSILVLGNHPEGKWLTPILCQWDVATAKPDEIQIPKICTEVKFKQDEQHSSKPELVLLPPKSVSDGIFMFLDSDRKGPGGQIKPYARSDFGLPNN